MEAYRVSGVLSESDGRVVPQFRAYAVVEKIGEFVSDPGGGVVSNTHVDIDSLESTIQYGETGKILQHSTTPYFTKDIA